MFKVVDMTPQLLQNGYVAGYNTPITPEIYEKLGYDPVGIFFGYFSGRDIPKRIQSDNPKAIPSKNEDY